MKTITSTTVLRILLLLAAILPFTEANAYDFEVGKLQYSITSVSTVKVTGANSNVYSIEIPNHVTFNNIEYTVTAIGDSAFYNTYISDAIIPETITSIGVAAFKKCGLSNLTFEAMIPPEMYDSFDQHEKPTSFIISTGYGYNDDILIVKTYKDAYPNYKNLNDENNYFSLILCIDGDATQTPSFVYYESEEGNPNSDNSSSTTITIYSEKNSYVFVRYSEHNGGSGEIRSSDLESYSEKNRHEDQVPVGSFTFTCDNLCMSTEYYLSAKAISEGKSESEENITYGTLSPYWPPSFDFAESNIYYKKIDQDQVSVSPCSYIDPCYYWIEGGHENDYYSKYYSGKVIIPETVIHDNITYNVTTIGDYTFYDSSLLKTLTIPKTITKIGDYAFQGCTALDTVNYNAISADFELYDYPIPFKDLNISTINIGDSVKTIPALFAAFLKKITSITIPCSVTYIGRNAFAGCDGLTRVNISDLSAWCNIDFVLSDYSDYYFSSNPLSVAHHLYLNDSEVTDLVIPNNVTAIRPIAFNGCIGLSSVTLSNSVTVIGFDAFEDCTGLTNVTIGNSVSMICYEAFMGCPNITSIKCLGKMPAIFGGFEKSDYDYPTFDDCVYQNAILYVPMDAVDAYKNAEGWKLFQHIVGFYDYDYEVDGVYYTVTGEDEVMVVQGDTPYQGVVSIPETVTFEGVTYNVTGISSGAFADATLQSLILPVTIASVEDGAFDGCHINSLIITGNGSWSAGAIAGEIDNLYVMSTVTGIGGLQVNPTTIYSYSTVPPTCNENTFTGYDGELHVPASSLAAYFTAPYWSNFINITGDAVEPTGIKFNNDSIEVLVGNQLSLNATITPSNATPRDIIWTTSDEQIATVTDGAITAIKAGECDIKAYLLDKIATCHVTVTEIVPTEVTLNQEFAKLEIGSQLTLTATVLPDNATDKQVTWATTNSAVATVDSLGHVTAVGEGECYITATCRDKQAMCHVIVVDHFIFITLDEHNVRLLPNHMMTLTPTVSPANTTLVVTSSDPTVAAARMANGKIQLVGIKEGSTVITVNSTDGYAEADSCLVKVYTLRGDVNSDGYVNISDVTSLINRLLGGPTPTISEENADANDDGKITIADVTALINSLLSGEPLPPKDEPIEDNLTFTVNGVTFTMVAVEGGTFTMGATPEQGDDALDGEKPAHQVTLSDYAIGQTEVTQALWVAVMGTNPSRFKDRPENPVELVDWNDCQAFITQLNQLTGRQFRLPTEAEWEYAARGGNKSQGYKYAGSNNVDEVAWYSDNCNSTQPVGTKKANELGIYDMSGNVWEWCQDYYGSYTSAAQTNPTGPATGTDRIRRGVGWNGSSSSGRVSHRSSREETYKYNSQGLRLAL